MLKRNRVIGRAKKMRVREIGIPIILEEGWISKTCCVCCVYCVVKWLASRTLRLPPHPVLQFLSLRIFRHISRFFCPTIMLKIMSVYVMRKSLAWNWRSHNELKLVNNFALLSLARPSLKWLNTNGMRNKSKTGSEKVAKPVFLVFHVLHASVSQAMCQGYFVGWLEGN